MITAGIDCGAKNTKTVVMRDGLIIGFGAVLTGFDQSAAVRQSLEMALFNAGVSRKDLSCIAGTGSGAKAIFEADVMVNEIRAMAEAGNFFFPSGRTIVDVGAEEARIARIGQKVTIVDFAINEKCAAGTGSFIEAMARALETPLEKMGELALSSENSIPMNAQCTIFAESEVVGLIHDKTAKEDISKAIHDSLASRIASMIRRVGIHPEMVLMGGVAYNSGLVSGLQKELGIGAILIPEKPEYGAAAGAAVVAAVNCQ